MPCSEIPATPFDWENLRDVLCNVSQIFNGWRPWEEWSTWDEEVAQAVVAIQRQIDVPPVQRAQPVADPAIDPVVGAQHVTSTREKPSSSSSSTSESLRGLATDLRAFLDDLDCGSYGERHYMDPDDVRHIVKDLRPLADRLDVLAGRSEHDEQTDG